MRRALLFLMLVFGITALNGQVTLLAENFGTTAGTFPANWTSSNATNGFAAQTTSPSGVYLGASGSVNARFINNGTNGATHSLIYSSLSTVGYSNITVLWGARATATFTQPVTFEWSTDGVTWNVQTYTQVANNATWSFVNGGTRIALPAGAANAPNLRFRFQITVNNNGNYQIDDFSVQGILAGKVSNGTGGGNWNDAATWNPVGVPTATEPVTILANDVVNTATLLTRNASTTVNGTFQLDAGGYAVGTNFTYGANGSLNFNNTSSYGVANTDVFWPAASGPVNVSVLQGGLTLNSMTRTVTGTFLTAAGVTLNSSTLRLNGTCQINTNGNFSNASPIYGPASTLIYNTGGTFGRGFEWLFNGVGVIGTSAGYPNNIIIQNNTTLDYNNGSPQAKALAGNLTISAGATLTMNIGTSDPQPLTVAGNLNNAGTFIQGNAGGANLRLGGNFTNTGSYNPNGRTVFFTRNGVQTVSGVSVIPYVVLEPSSGSTTLQLLSNLTVSAPVGGAAITFTNTNDVLDINGFSLVIGTSGVGNTVAGPGAFRGSASSGMVLQGTGSIGTLRFASGGQELNNLTLIRTAGSVAMTLGSALTVNGALTMGGHLDVAANVLTLGATATNPSASSSNYIIADAAAGSEVRRIFTGPGTYSFSIGDAPSSADGSQFSPVAVTLTGGTYPAGSFVSASVADVKHPNYDATSEFISRYWRISSGVFSGPTAFTARGTYLDVDINSPLAESNYQGNNWNGTAWSNSGSPVVAASNNTNAIPVIAGVVNEITAGRRDMDINVVQGTTQLPSGSTYDFGEVLVGSTAPVVFTIQNLGQISLTLSNAAPAPVAPFVYTTPYTLGSISGPTGTRPFTVTFTPTAAGTFTGSISIPNNDPTGGENPYVINFTGVGKLPAPEINVRGVVGANPSIFSGDTTPSGTDNTQFATTPLGGSQTKTFRIENIGTAALNVSSVIVSGGNAADFIVAASAPYTIPNTGTTSVDFTITFTPLASGLRTTTVIIAHNDATDSESPYAFVIEGTATCPTITNTITPASGPAGTEVTITSTGSLTGASVSFNGTPATSIIPVSATQIKVIVPAGAVTGPLITTNAQGCVASTIFTMINNVSTGCEGGNTVPNLFIAEVTDASSGNLSYVEIYNGTGAAVNLGGYSLRVENNGGGTPTIINLNSVVLPDNDMHIVALGATGTFCAVPGGDGSFADQTAVGGGVNFDNNGSDFIGLYQGATLLDSWGVQGSSSWSNSLGIGTNGATFRRKNNVTVPSATFILSQWIINDWVGTGASSCGTNDYSDVGFYNFINGNPPTITVQPTYTPTCKETSFTVTATEGFVGGNALTYQWFVTPPGAAGWSAVVNGGVYSGATTPTLEISSVASLQGYQFYLQVRENTATCYTASNAVLISGSPVSTWNGSSWSPAAPTANSIAIINGNYNTAIHGSFTACSVTVNGTFQLNIAAGNYVEIVNDLTVQNTATLFVADDASLVMIEDSGIVSNLGTTQIQKTTSPYNKFDYTYWSSPVTSTTIGAAFPGWRTDYSFSFNTANYADIAAPVNGFDDDNNAWQFAGPTAVLQPGRGYAVMAPTTGSFPATSTVTFSGAVNNGIITVPLALSGNAANTSDDFVLLGNPYPSALSADDFINANTNISGTLYFWTHRTGISSSNPGPDANNFITSDYAMYNLSGGTSSGTGSPVPTGFVASGQGFFVEAVTATNVVYNNSMRSSTYANNLFYRASAALAANSERDRIWINMERADGLFSQILVGYFPEATLGFDRGYDGVVNPTSNSISLYTFIDGEHYRIQGRPAFDVTDVVPMGYVANLAGNYTISIGNREGALAAAGQKIYLEDLLSQITVDLTESPYSFSTETGMYNDRFLLKYSNESLGDANPEFLQQSVKVITAGDVLTVRSDNSEIAEVRIYDITGRLLSARYDNAREVEFTDLVRARQPLLVRVKLTDGTETTRKVLF